MQSPPQRNEDVSGELKTHIDVCFVYHREKEIKEVKQGRNEYYGKLSKV